MKQPLIILIFTFLFPAVVHAIELENRLPASVWKAEMRLHYTPPYNRAFNGYGKEAPLQNLILWDREWRDSVEGKLQREAQSLEIRMAYGLTETWMVKAFVPFLQKKQSSTLKFKSVTSNQQKVLDNLASENLSGLGDIEMIFIKDMVF